MTKKCNRLRGERPKAFWGALVGGAMNLIGSAISSKSQARAIRRQIEAQKEAARTQLELANNSNLASTLNSYATATRSYNDEDDYNLKYRLGGNKRLGSNRIYITDGGNATKIGNDTYLLRGGSHEQTNETGQTGIGINVGGNEVEAEGGEVAQKKNGALRIFSAQPILSNGMSPAQAILRGYNKDSVFSQQQAFKKRNGLKDDGSKAAFGNLITMPFAGIAKNVVDYFTNSGRYAPKRVKVSNKTVNKKPIRNGQVGNFRVVNGKRIPNEKPLRRVYPEFDIISMGRGLPVGKAAKATAKAAKNEVSYINRISKSRLYSDNPIINTYATYARKYNLPDKARVPYMIRRVKSDELPSINNGRITMSGGRFKHTNFTYDRPVVSHRKGKWDTAQQTYLINGRRLVSENKGNWGSIEPSDMFTIQDPKEGLTVPTKDVILVSGHKGLLNQAKTSGIKIATSPQLQRIEKSITPRQSLGRFNLAGGERRHYNTPYWIDVNNIVKEYGTPKLKDVRLLEEMTGLKSGVSKLNNNAIKIINDAKGFDKLSLNEAEQVMNQTYPNGRGVNFTNDRETYVTSQLPYNSLFYDPTTYAESNYVFPKRFGGRCKLRNGGLTSKDRGSSKHPYTSVSSKDFAGGGRSYPIPTKADAVDALRLAGLHGRSDVKAKVYSRYPELRKKARNGAEIEPYYDWARNTSSNLGISFIDPTYDYRAYYDSVTPYERALIRFAPQGTHFTDIGKTPKHPTFSNESKYSNDKTPGGTWNGNVFVPNIWQFGNNGNSRRNKYMNNSGEGYFNGRVNVFPTSRKKHSLGGRMQLKNGGSWKAPVYNTNKYRVSNRMRRQIATWEGSDFAGQNRRFKGDAIGAKERELRRMMGRTYNYLNDNQRDSLNSIYYNSQVDTFKNAFGKWFRNLNSAVDRGDERAFNNSLAGIRQSMTVGENRKGMSGLAKRRAWERNWFGNPIPMVSNETKAILKQQAEARMVQPTDNTRVVIQPDYIEVPAPVGHGIVPVDNPDPNLLQGNIKDNLINMGNKFRLGQRCGGSTRMCKALGGESRPVKGMRRKLAWGDVTYPYRRNNNFDYWDIIDQEQKANDKGGISPWTTSNNYDVKVPYAITKSTPTIPYTSQVSTPTAKLATNTTIPTYIGNKSGMIIRDADWYGLGADLLSSIGGSILGLGAYKNLDFDYNLPNFVEESPVALNTTYHNEAQKSNVERNRLNSRNSILRNTMSGSTAVGRMQGVDTNALYQLNQLADEKTNKETELMNQNLLNEQQVRARNAAARNQYYNTVASIKNAAIQAKNEAELAKGQILSGSLQGIGNSFQNFISQGRQNYDDTQAMLMGVAASDYATPSRLLELGVDVGDDAALAGIYRSAMNIPNPGARPKREDYSDNTEYSYALTRWENQNKAYQRRNSYADLIKGRMSKKNLIKYGII